MATLNSDILSTVQPEDIDTSGEFQGLKTAAIASIHIIHDTYQNFISPLIPVLIERLSLLKVQAGLFLLFYQGVSVLQPVIGHWADRINLRKLALIAPAITGIFLSLLGTAQSYPIALLYCFMAGISSACMHAILPALVGSLSGNQIGKGMSFWMVGGELGAVFGPIVITAVIASSSISRAPWLMIGGILASIVLSYVTKDIPFHNSNNNTAPKIQVKELAAIMLPMGAILLMRSMLRSSFENYLPVYLTEQGVGVWLAGASLSFLQGFGVLGVILGGFANDRFGYKPVMFISIVFSGIGMLMFLFSSGIMQIASLALAGIASMMMLPVGMAVVQDFYPNNRSLANGIYLAMLFSINAIMGVTTGFFYDQIGGHQTYLAAGLIGFLGIPFVFMLPNQKKYSKI